MVVLHDRVHTFLWCDEMLGWGGKVVGGVDPIFHTLLRFYLGSQYAKNLLPLISNCIVFWIFTLARAVSSNGHFENVPRTLGKLWRWKFEWKKYFCNWKNNAGGVMINYDCRLVLKHTIQEFHLRRLTAKHWRWISLRSEPWTSYRRLCPCLMIFAFVSHERLNIGLPRLSMPSWKYLEIPNIEQPATFVSNPTVYISDLENFKFWKWYENEPSEHRQQQLRQLAEPAGITLWFYSANIMFTTCLKIILFVVFDRILSATDR